MLVDLVLEATRLLTPILMILAAFRLWRTGLSGKYRVFFAYLIFHSLRSAVLYPLSLRSNAYFYVWGYSEPILCIFYFLLVLELYTLVLEKYKGIQSLSRWILYASMVASVILAGFSLIPGANYRDSSYLAALFFGERAVFWSLLIFLVLLITFLSRYPVPLTRNVIIHSLIYSLYFFSHGFGVLLVSMLGKSLVRPAGAVLALVTTGCVAAWAFLLNPGGEAGSIQLSHAWQKGDDERLIQQLTAFNESLLRAARK